MRRTPEPEQADPSPELAAALDQTAQQLAEREAAEQIARARAEAACLSSLARKECRP